jgi:hypothetical protein
MFGQSMPVTFQIARIDTGPEPIHGLTNTIEGVQAQWEHAALEARLLAREYVEL